MKVTLSEADIKTTCESMLYALMNMEKLIYLRLNSGDLILDNGNGSKRRVRCCPGGTSDGLVVGRKGINVFVEYKSPTGKQTREQRAFEQKVQGQGHQYWLVSDFEAFKDAIEEIL